MKKETGEVHGRWGVIRETPEQMLARMNAKYGLGMPEISRATAATSPNQATCSISSTFSAERLDGQGDRCDWPAQRRT